MKNKIVVFGTGKGGKLVFKQYSKESNVLAFCDNAVEEQGSYLFRKKIIAPSELVQLKFDQILIASQYSDSIFVQLIKMQVDPEKIKIIRMEQLAGTPQNISILKQLLCFLFLTFSRPILCIYDIYKRREYINSCRKL